jgi:transcriptional regulator with XRE-family HTH domain
MSHQRQRTGTGGTGEFPEGLVAGHLLRLVREQLGLTQEACAEQLRVDLNTLRSWETGRRPLANVKVGHLRALLRRLQTLGANPVLLAHVETAIEVDLFLGQVLMEAGRGDPAEHMLANWVSTHAWNDLLAWAIGGGAPKTLARHLPCQRRGPVPARPDLGAPARARFFDALRDTAERADASATLLRRQVYFLAAWDDSTDGRNWLQHAERAELRRVAGGSTWTPGWAAERSLAVARARQGDRDYLRRFIATRLDDDLCEAANLNYWSYWAGEGPRAATSDAFMATDLGSWRGAVLLRHLAAGLDPATAYVELSVHTVWALLGRRPYLLGDDSELTASLDARISRLLDADDISTQARRELDQTRFLIAAKGTTR